MNSTALREAMGSGKAFSLRSGDGVVTHVPTRDHISVSPNGRLAVVFTDEGGARVLDVVLITAIDYDKAPDNLRVQEGGTES